MYGGPVCHVDAGEACATRRPCGSRRSLCLPSLLPSVSPETLSCGLGLDFEEEEEEGGGG
ncbi:hypothetical protein HanIR_Chr12g0604671 [Helianthus annuus]|nr:hypothetical protein HanIR_Chr12g0604671 [Helianthus annuus]